MLILGGRSHVFFTSSHLILETYLIGENPSQEPPILLPLSRICALILSSTRRPSHPSLPPFNDAVDAHSSTPLRSHNSSALVLFASLLSTSLWSMTVRLGSRRVES